MYDTAAMATTVRFTPVSQRPRLLSVSSIDSRSSRSPSGSLSTPPIVNQEAYASRSDSFSDFVPSPQGIKLPHTRYIPIRSHSSTAIPSPHSARPSLGRAPHSVLAASPSLLAPMSSEGMRQSDEDLWSRPLGNYSFCNSYDATCSPTESRSGSRQSSRSKLSSRQGSQKAKRSGKARYRSDGDCEHIGAWFKKLWRR